MNGGTAQSSSLFEVSSALAGEDLKYWAEHPELPALLSHFMAKGDQGFSSVSKKKQSPSTHVHGGEY